MPLSRISHTNSQPRVRFLQLEICRHNQCYLLKALNFCSHLGERCTVFPGTQTLKNMNLFSKEILVLKGDKTNISLSSSARWLVFQSVPPHYVSPFKQRNYETAVAFASFVTGKEQQSEVAAGEQDCNILRVPSVENGWQKTEGKETNRDSNVQLNSSFLTTYLRFFGSISSNCSKGKDKTLQVKCTISVNLVSW